MIIGLLVKEAKDGCTALLIPEVPFLNSEPNTNKSHVAVASSSVVTKPDTAPTVAPPE